MRSILRNEGRAEANIEASAAADDAECVRFSVVREALRRIRAQHPPGFAVDRLDHVVRTQTRRVGGTAGANVGTQVPIGRSKEGVEVGGLIARARGDAGGEEIPASNRICKTPRV